MCILAFDLGDFNALSAWRFLDRETGEVRCGSVLTTMEAMSALLAQLQPKRVLCESCAMAGFLHDVVEAILPASECVAANTNADAWRWKNVKCKTDANDAERLLRLDLVGEIQPVLVPSQEIRAMRRFMGYRQQLVWKRTACYNAIRFCCKQQLITIKSKEQAWSKKGLEELDALCADKMPGDWTCLWKNTLSDLLAQVRLLNEQLDAVEKQLTQWEKQHDDARRLQTAPGIGHIVSLAILVFLGDPKRFRSGKHVAAYFGLVPRIYQSGNSCRQGHITKAGNRLVRTLLINAAWQAVRHDPWAEKLFNRLTGGVKTRRKIAIIAVARRLIVRCWAMLRDGTDWKDTEGNEPNNTTPKKKTRTKKSPQKNNNTTENTHAA